MLLTEVRLIGKVNGVGLNQESEFEFAYDKESNILHLSDNHKKSSTSLINAINNRFKIKLLDQLNINDKGVRCFVYSDNIVTEYSEEREEGALLFSDIEDNSLLYKPFDKR